jgi:hypothetical protein
MISGSKQKQQQKFALAAIEKSLVLKFAYLKSARTALMCISHVSVPTMLYLFERFILDKALSTRHIFKILQKVAIHGSSPNTALGAAAVCTHHSLSTACTAIIGCGAAVSNLKFHQLKR